MTITSGSCLCGKVKISYRGEPALKALCHCADCRKISGSTYSVNNVVSEQGFRMTGSPKSFTKTADSGKRITSWFCGECGSTLWREGDNFEGMKIVKVGVLDGGLEKSRPGVELFASGRVGWLGGLEGAEQKDGM